MEEVTLGCFLFLRGKVKWEKSFVHIFRFSQTLDTICFEVERVNFSI